MVGNAWLPSRRGFVAGIGALGAATILLTPGRGRGDDAPQRLPPPGDHGHDWQWLVGTWDVRNRRLKERLAGSTEWAEYPGKSALWLTMGGLGTIDDNAFLSPAGTFRAMGIRAFDPQSQRWAIWWLDGRGPMTIDSPMLGRFEGDEGVFDGTDTLRGKPVDTRYHWQDIHSARPHWQQSFSADGGKSWEMNFENFFTRTAATPAPVPALPGEAPHAAPDDWAFLVGSWHGRHRKLKQRLAGSKDWDEFDGTLVNWPVMGGAGNAGDNVMNLPTGTVRGVGFRAYDPTSRKWLSWWLDGRDPLNITDPMSGGFTDGVGTLQAADTHDGKPVIARVRWTLAGRNSARWEQSFSTDGGASWEINWVTEFTRQA